MDFSVLKGKTLTKVDGLDTGSDVIRFTCSDGSEYHMYHEQDCCESVDIEDITGDVDALTGALVLEAYESSDCLDATAVSGVGEWTYYHIRTMHTSVVIRWYGESNGYYSTSVFFSEIKKPNPSCGDNGWAIH